MNVSTPQVRASWLLMAGSVVNASSGIGERYLAMRRTVSPVIVNATRALAPTIAATSAAARAIAPPVVVGIRDRWCSARSEDSSAATTILLMVATVSIGYAPTLVSADSITASAPGGDRAGHVGDLGAGRARRADHRLEHLGRHDDRAGPLPGQLDRPRLHGGHLLKRQLDAQVAAGDHDAVEGVHDVGQDIDRFRLLDLGDQRDAGAAHVGHDLAGQARVVRGADEGHRDDVRAGGQGPAQVGLVLFRQRGGADADAGQVDALVVGDLPADDDPQVHAAAADAGDVELDVAVVDEDAVAGPHVVGEALVGGGRLALVTGDVLGGDDELVAGREADGAAGELPEADLRPLEVGEDADGPAGRLGPGPEALVGLKVVGLRRRGSC